MEQNHSVGVRTECVSGRGSIAIVLILFIAFFFRTYQLDRIGFSEDEANKILAAREYLQGKFTGNAEHPMLMKWLGAAFLYIADQSGLDISPETAIRLPSAIFGSLSALAMYLIGNQLFGPAVGLIAATLWAVDINAVALSRIAKEDSLVTFFFLLANYFLLRGKHLHFRDRRRANASYLACGASFGMLFASKYLVPILWITPVYYDLLRFKKEPRWRLDRRTILLLWACFTATFLLFNPVILKSEVWHYIVDHFKHERMSHSGYYMMEKIFLNKAYHTFWGQPFYFFTLFLFVKTTLPALSLLFAGLAYTLRRIREDHFLFLALYFFVWIFLLSLPGGKFTRYVISLLPAVFLIQAIGISLLYSAIASFLSKRNRPVFFQWATMTVLIVITAGWSMVQLIRYHPYYSFYVNAVAGGESRWGYYFPQDEFYDAGLREAIRHLSLVAPQNAIVLGTTPAAVQYYTSRFGRSDIRFLSMANQSLRLNPDEKYWLLWQDYRRYFENHYILVFARALLRPVRTVTANSMESVTLYCISKEDGCARAPFWKAKYWSGVLSTLSKR